MVTGNPGAGKSAVLGYVVTASDGEERRAPELRDLLLARPPETRPAEACVDFAMHLKNRTLAEVREALAACFASQGDEVLSALANRGKKTVLVFDALEEATDAAEIAAGLLRPLTGYQHLFLLIGSRRPEMAALGARVKAVDLDELRDGPDIRDYALRLLLAPLESKINPYRGKPETGARAAAAVAGAARGNFLVARINVQTLPGPGRASRRE